MVRDPLHAFWINIQYAHEFMPPLAVPNPARLKPEEVEKWFRLTPHTAEGFQEEAFSFLPPNELATLKAAVEGLRLIATEIPSGIGATAEQKKQALPEFQIIIDTLAPDRFADPEALKFGKQIEAKLESRRLEKLDHLRFSTGLDSTGEPALWIWAYTKENATGKYEEEAFFAAIDVIAPVLNRAAEEVAQDRWAYISYRSTLDKLEYEAAV